MKYLLTGLVMYVDNQEVFYKEVHDLHELDIRDQSLRMEG